MVSVEKSFGKTRSWNTFLLYSVAIAIRLVIFSLPPIADTLLQRVELSTPVTSFKRLTEGVFLYQSHVPPYDGGVFHQAPLLLIIFSFLLQLPDMATFLLYSIFDIAIAHCLQKITLMKQQFERNQPTLAIEKEIDLIHPTTVAALYLFNPLTILSCVSKSTILFTNLSVIMALSWALIGRYDFSMMWIALASYLSVYPAMLVPPLILLLPRRNMTMAITSFVGTLLVLLGISRLVVGSWEFLNATYGVILFLPDLTPNVGMFWYFFIEIFDQFRSFFLMVFQFHTFIFVAPLCIRFRNRPVFVLTILCGIVAVFKSYPSVGDATLYLSLVPLHDELFKYCRYGFLVANLFLYSSVLAPIFWHLWIYAGSGNANFFYAITLVYNLGQVMLLIDLVYSMLRREFDIAHPEAIGKQVIHEQN
ncbi:GPI transamidase subunit PIG-U [Halteromyces radiatus]|uniref:GPI transamidase subunit PIG-U n=1 Tax=Halteromyces radiatus TaxID=101107 RepID=UPI00221F6772|nr:GPI transamidase subunit PIG-U [Halteromyces radiatus]KAI8099917.1 GPI transamidase subunit PIG-U [Halteromyces radiatus]